MLRRAILDPREVSPDGTVPEGRPLSYGLLAAGGGSADREAVVFEVVARRVLHSTGVCRTSYRGRLRDVDQAARPYLDEAASAGGALAVHDWAVSDALASAEWAEEVLAAYPGSSFTASDLNLHLVEVRTPGARYIFEADGTPLQLVRSPYVLSLRAGRCGSAAREWLRQLGVMRARKVWRRAAPRVGAVLAGAARADGGGCRVQFLPLIHPQARALAARTERFQIVGHSVFSPLPAPVEVIRSMNILNYSYFSAERLVEGARAVLGSLKPGGFWIVGRSRAVGSGSEERNATSIMSRSVDGFAVRHRMHGGAEIEDALRAAGLLL
jgi:hypothetical protein